jgi:hypothetical protein
MQDELGTGRILGVNAVGSEAGNDAICTGRDLPWLQDTADQHVWSQWQVTYRDVIVLDEDNGRIEVYNLTDHDLSDPANYAALLALLLAAGA